MKKLLMFTTALLISLSLMGCNSNKDKGVTEEDVNKGTETDLVEENNTDKVNEGTETNTDKNGGNETKLEVAEDAASRVVELDEVDSATVIVTDNNAYAAVVLGDNHNAEEDLTDELEDKIAEKVRGADTDIENVYVSLNPDFVERMTDYRTKINDGEPVEGLFEEFTESVKRVFPDNH